jgi:cytochrome c-type biogenesis protein CcmH/NrfF
MSVVRSSPIRRWLPWAVMAVIAVTVLVLGTRSDGAPRSNADRIIAIEKTVRCPECRGQSIFESDAPVSKSLREYVATQVAAGRTDDQIRAEVESKFPGTSLLPPSSGLGALVWIVPVVATIVAAGALALAFRRWSRQAAIAGGPSEDDRVLVAAALEHFDDER